MALTLRVKASFLSSKVLEKSTFLVKRALGAVYTIRKQAKKGLEDILLNGLEILRDHRGVFTAALSDDYNACWMRDQLYANFAYYYLGDLKKFKQGIRVVFNMLENSREKIEAAAVNVPKETHDYIHAKFSSETLGEITNNWGHHQVDAIGLFLYMIGFAYERGIDVVKTDEDKEMLQLLVHYLTTIRYWEAHDNGMWEEWQELHASSIGAALAGLKKIKEQKLAVVPKHLIVCGEKALSALLPKETPVRDQDMAQLSLIWPYHVISDDMRDEILNRVTQNLVQSKGLNRYLNDNYYRSDNGISAEWTMGFFWLSIIYSEMGLKHDAEYWFNHGVSTMTQDGLLPELYQNGRPNKNTPLGWSHSLALIAQKKLKKNGVTIS